MVVTADPARSHALLTSWQWDPVSVVGLCLELVLAVGYLYAAGRARRQRPWPRSASACFVAGLLVLAVTLQSGVAAYDDVFWVHVVQHTALMSIAPPLFALGAPVTLLLRALPTAQARRVVAALHLPMTRALSGHAARWHVPVDYYALMFIYLLSPAYSLSLHNEVTHVVAHMLFLVCGVMFWVPMLGRDPTGWRPTSRTRVALVAAGLPVNAVLAAAVGSWSLFVTSEVASVLGLGLVLMLVQARGSRARVRAAARPQALPLTAARS